VVVGGGRVRATGGVSFARRWLAFASYCLLPTAYCLLPSALCAPAQAAPSLQTRVGLGGYGRMPGRMAVVVEIDNPGAALEGRLEIADAHREATFVPVSLAGGARKRFTAYLPAQPSGFAGQQDTIGVRLRAGRQVVAQQQGTARLL